jgi:hypothetical protein
MDQGAKSFCSYVQLLSTKNATEHFALAVSTYQMVCLDTYRNIPGRSIVLS